MESLADSRLMDEFVSGQAKHGVFMRTGVDLDLLDARQKIFGVIPVRIDSRPYELDAKAGTIETPEGCVKTCGAQFREVVGMLERRLEEYRWVTEHKCEIMEAMAVAGYFHDEDLRFNYEGGSLRFNSLVDVYDWLKSVVIDDPMVSDEVERTLKGVGHKPPGKVKIDFDIDR